MNDGLGFFCIDRKIFNHDIFRDPEKFRAWIDLIGYHARGTDNGRLQRSQFQVAERDLAKRWHWTRSTVHRFIDYLKDEAMIELIKPPAPPDTPAIYGIVNYEKYNGVAKVKSSKKPIKPHVGPIGEPLSEPIAGPINPQVILPLTVNDEPITGPISEPITEPFFYKEETKRNNVKQGKQGEGYGESADAPITLGEFGHVHLTPVQFTNLKLALNGYTDRYITRFDLWVHQAPQAKANGVRREDRDAYASIRTWYNRDREEGKLGQRELQRRESEAEAKMRRTKENAQRLRDLVAGKTSSSL